MIKQEQRVYGENRIEIFDYYLSAFLNAAMSLRCAFQYRQNRARNQAIKTWREQWESRLTPEEKSLYKFMREDRVAEVHCSGSSRNVGEEGVPLPAGTCRTRRDGIFITDDGMVSGSGPNFIYRPSYSFTIDGANPKATEACRKYLALLQRMVAQFEADHR